MRTRVEARETAIPLYSKPNVRRGNLHEIKCRVDPQQASGIRGQRIEDTAASTGTAQVMGAVEES